MPSDTAVSLVHEWHVIHRTVTFRYLTHISFEPACPSLHKNKKQQAFSSDQDRIGYADYLGESYVRAKLLPGTVYYIAVHTAANASHYLLTTPVSFSLDLSSSWQRAQCITSQCMRRQTRHITCWQPPCPFRWILPSSWLTLGVRAEKCSETCLRAGQCMSSKTCIMTLSIMHMM